PGQHGGERGPVVLAEYPADRVTDDDDVRVQVGGLGVDPVGVDPGDLPHRGLDGVQVGQAGQPGRARSGGPADPRVGGGQFGGEVVQLAAAPADQIGQVAQVVGRGGDRRGTGGG